MAFGGLLKISFCARNKLGDLPPAKATRLKHLAKRIDRARCRI